MGKHGRTKQRRTLAEQYAWLDGREAMKQLPADLRRRRQHLLRRQRDKIERDAPSSTWADAVWVSGEEFPTGWVACKTCGRMRPVDYAASDHCIDCRLHALPKPVLMALPAGKAPCATAAVCGIGKGVLGR